MQVRVERERESERGLFTADKKKNPKNCADSDKSLEHSKAFHEKSLFWIDTRT